MTCGVRNVKFTVDARCVVPVEFAHNRLLLVSAEPASVKIMEKCPSGIREYTMDTDTVILVPNNCSYVSSSIAVDVREADLSITKEIGMIHFEKIGIVKVDNRQDKKTKTQINLTKELVDKFANSSLNHERYLQMHNDIEAKLNGIDFKHSSLWSVYSQEKWILIGILVFVFSSLVSIKLIQQYRKCRQLAAKKKGIVKSLGTNASAVDIEMPELKLDITQQQQQQQQPQRLQQHTRLHKHNQTDEHIQTHDHAYDSERKDKENMYTEIDGNSSVNFSSPKERSQFYSK